MARTGQTNSCEYLFRTLAHPRCFPPHFPTSKERGHGYIFATGQMIEEVVGLEDVTDHPIPISRNLGITVGSKISSIHLDRAVIGGIETTDEIEQSRFSGARPADDRNEVIRINRQIDAAKDINVGAGITLANSFESNHRQSVARYGPWMPGPRFKIQDTRSTHPTPKQLQITQTQRRWDLLCVYLRQSAQSAGKIEWVNGNS